VTDTAQLVGVELAPFSWSWTSTDGLLYAVAVGAGGEGSDLDRELCYITENSYGVAQRVLPTFAVLVAGCGGRAETLAMEAAAVADLAYGVHGEQEIELYQELPTEGTVTVQPRICAIDEKSTGTVLTVETEAVDANQGKLCTARSSVFFRKPQPDTRTKRDVTPPPEARAADHVVHYSTRKEQAYLYRLAVGDRNPLHSDPKFARRVGFERPILHGLCTYGFAGRALLDILCGGDPVRLKAMSGRFTRPVSPGDELTVSIWLDGERPTYEVATQNGSNVLKGWCVVD
jgi:acyl dehydratase